MKYTGIGSRSCPLDECAKLVRIAQILATRRHVLRSGGADGADKAFEDGHKLANNHMEIYIPWRKFVPKVESYHIVDIDRKTEAAAAKIASEIHPAWSKCSQGAKKLHTRNIYQVLGQYLNEPSDFLIGWTPNGEAEGGSRTAIVLAENNGVPVFNTNSVELRSLSAMDTIKYIASRISGKL